MFHINIDRNFNHSSLVKEFSILKFIPGIFISIYFAPAASVPGVCLLPSSGLPASAD